MYRAKVDANGRITIPAELREKLNLQSGRTVKFEEIEDGTCLLERQQIIIQLLTPGKIKLNVVLLGMKGKLLKSLMDDKKIEREF